MNWQPIETAPNDRYIMVYTPDSPGWNGNMFVVKWFGDGPVRSTTNYGEVDCFWTCGGPNGGIDLDGITFTNWMPLPEPPK